MCGILSYPLWTFRVNIPIKQTTSVNMCCGHAYTIPMITYVRHWSSHIWTRGYCATCWYSCDVAAGNFKFDTTDKFHTYLLRLACL